MRRLGGRRAPRELLGGAPSIEPASRRAGRERALRSGERAPAARPERSECFERSERLEPPTPTKNPADGAGPRGPFRGDPRRGHARRGRGRVHDGPHPGGPARREEHAGRGVPRDARGGEAAARPLQRPPLACGRVGAPRFLGPWRPRIARRYGLHDGRLGLRGGARGARAAGALEGHEAQAARLDRARGRGAADQNKEGRRALRARGRLPERGAPRVSF